MAGPSTPPRRQERIFAFKVLYALCFHQVETLEQLSIVYNESPDRPNKAQIPNSFSWRLVLGVWEKQNDIDVLLSSFSENWRVDRMGKVELTLLRIAMFELIHCSDIPPKVALNEAVELSKQFGDDNSRNFVNGVLDAAACALDKRTLTKSV